MSSARHSTRGGRLRLLLIAIFACLAAVMPAHAADDVTFRLDTKRVWVDGQARIVISMTNPEEIGEPTFPTVDGLEFRALGRTNEMNSFTVVNGRASQRRIVETTLEVTPRRAGTFTIPPIEIEVDGRAWRSERFRLEAVASTFTPLDVLIESDADPVFEGQTIPVKLVLEIDVFTEESLDIEVGESTTWRLIDAERSAWGPFERALMQMRRDSKRPLGRRVQGESGPRWRYEIPLAWTATANGPMRGLDEVEIRMSWPTGVRRTRSVFGGEQLSFSGLAPVRASADLRLPAIEPVPTEGRPATFQGAVGRYLVRSASDTTAVAEGDPIRLTLAIGDVEGDGTALETLRPPAFAEITALTDGFIVPRGPVAGEVDERVKSFEIEIRPRSTRVVEIPSIPFSYFDPETRTYQTVRTEPIPITVTPGERISTDDLLGTDAATSRPSPIADGVDGEGDAFLTWRPGPLDDEGLMPPSARRGAWPSPLLLVLGITPPLTFAALAGVLVVARVRARREPLRRTRRCGRRARRAIAHAADAASVETALRGYACDRRAIELGRSVEVTTSREAIALLRDASVPDDAVGAFEAAMREAERGAWASPGALDALRARAREAVDAIDSHRRPVVASVPIAKERLP